MIRLNRERQRLLTMLAGCPDGCTHYLLTSTHRFPPTLLYSCLEENLVSVQQQTVAARGAGIPAMTLYRFKITEAGRAAINSGAGC